jgi:hypothetical protein
MKPMDDPLSPRDSLINSWSTLNGILYDRGWPKALPPRSLSDLDRDFDEYESKNTRECVIKIRDQWVQLRKLIIIDLFHEFSSKLIERIDQWDARLRLLLDDFRDYKENFYSFVLVLRLQRKARPDDLVHAFGLLRHPPKAVVDQYEELPALLLAIAKEIAPIKLWIDACHLVSAMSRDIAFILLGLGYGT